MLSCLYHPFIEMQVLDDASEEYKCLLSSGVWFTHPSEAKQLGEKYGKDLLKYPKQRENISNGQSSADQGRNTAEHTERPGTTGRDNVKRRQRSGKSGSEANG
jgi:hypothetical protein